MVSSKTNKNMYNIKTNFYILNVPINVQYIVNIFPQASAERTSVYTPCECTHCADTFVNPPPPQNIQTHITTKNNPKTHADTVTFITTSGLRIHE